MALHKYFCTFPQDLISEPIISHTLGSKFGKSPIPIHLSRSAGHNSLNSMKITGRWARTCALGN